MPSPIPFRPRIGKTDSSLYAGLLAYAQRHQFNVGRLNTGASLASQGIGEVAAEVGHDPADLARRRMLTKGLASRTTESSRQRLLNRILAMQGLTTGTSGTVVNPRRF